MTMMGAFFDEVATIGVANETLQERRLYDLYRRPGGLAKRTHPVAGVMTHRRSLRARRRPLRTLLCCVFGFLCPEALIFSNESPSDLRVVGAWNAELSKYDGGICTSRYIYSGRGWVGLQLHNAKILAQGIYLYGDKVKLLWLEDRLIYENREDGLFRDETVRLPPTWLDRWMARWQYKK